MIEMIRGLFLQTLRNVWIAIGLHQYRYFFNEYEHRYIWFKYSPITGTNTFAVQFELIPKEWAPIALQRIVCDLTRNWGPFTLPAPVKNEHVTEKRILLSFLLRFLFISVGSYVFGAFFKTWPKMPHAWLFLMHHTHTHTHSSGVNVP